MYINKKETQRQVPKTQEYTANPLYTDILYGYLQAQCEIEGGEKNKFLPKKLINYSKIGEDLEMTRQTASKKFNNLIKLGLVQEREDGYELITLEKTDAFLISLSMLRKLVSALKERTITCYIYLLNRFFAAGEKEYEFTIDQLKTICGLSTKSHTNNYIITDILEILQAMRLIVFSCRIESTEGKPKKKYVLVWATNQLP